MLAKKAIEHMESSTPHHVTALLSETFERTTRLVFIPQELHRIFYIELACRERVYCSVFPAGHRFSCGHLVWEHIKALGQVEFCMARPQSQN